MTGFTVRRQIRSGVIRIERGFKIGLMAGETIRRSVGKFAAAVTFRTVIGFMAFGEGEKIVVDRLRTPIGFIEVVTLHAIGGKTSVRVARIGGSIEFVEVTIHAIISDAIEAQGCLRGMTFEATHRGVRSQ